MTKFTNNTAGKAHVKTAFYSCIKFVVLLITLFISVNSFCQTLVSENFENPTFPPAGWVVINAGSGNNWVRSTSTTSPAQYAGSTAYMLYGYNTAAAANTWAFTPVLSLTAGTNYLVEFQEATAVSTTYPENMKVTIGNAQTVASQTTTLLNLPGLLNTAYIKRTVNFTVATSGNYSIAFNCYSAADEFNLAIDEIKVRVPAVPDAPPASFTVSGVTQTGMTIGWTDNSTNETAFKVYRSTDNINFTQVGADITSTSSATTGTTYSSAQTGLLPGVTYYYRIASSNTDGQSVFLTGSQATLAAGNITSVGSGGLWSSTATWSTGTVPTSTDNVTIADGSTVTIDIPSASCLSLLVGQGTSGELNYINTPASALSVVTNVTVATNASFNAGAGTITTHALTVGGNLTNNGTLDFFTTAGVGITFTGAANNSFSGTGATTDIRTLTINKGTSTANILELTPSNLTVQGTSVDGTPMAFLTLTNGTLKVSGSFTLAGRVFSAAAYTIPATGGFWLNNPNFTVSGQAGNATCNGLFRITQGTFNHGTATGNIFNLAANSTTIIEGGAVNCTGRFGTAAAGTVINYTQTAGTVTVCTIGYSSTTLASFDLGTSTSSTVNISGGTIVCQLANSGASGPRDFRNNGGAGIATVTGGTLQLGNSLSGTAKSFVIGNVVPNILVTSTSGNHTATFTTTLTNYNNVSLNITTQPGATINLANGVFLFNGNTITNNGIFTHNGTSSRFITFSPATNITFAGSGTVTAPVTSLELQNDLNFTITSTANIVVGRIITFSGSFVNANKLTLGTGGATASTIQIGNTTTPTGGGTFDAAPTFNLGTGGESISYLRTINSKTTGPEINPARALVSLTYDDDNTAHTLTLAGGALSSGTLNLTNGKIVNGSNLLTVTGTTVASIAGGSATSYVMGPLARTLPASLATGSTYTFPIGKSGLNAFDLVNPTTNSNGTATVRAEVFDANSGGTPGNLMSAISTSRYWAASLNGSTAANFISSQLRLNDTRGTQDGIAASATVNGVYDHVGGTASTLTATSITTTPPALTSIGNFYVMGNLGAAVLTNLTITPAGNQCVNVARTVTVTATPTGAPVTSVTLNYSVNGGTLQTVNMTNTGGNNWSGMIPTITPPNGTVSWSVTATDANNLVATATGTSYSDEPITTVVASATSTTVCLGSPTTLSLTFTSPLTPDVPAASSYCASTHSSGCLGDNIARVVLNTLDNTTGTTCGSTSSAYSYITGGGSKTTTLTGGSLYSLAVTFGTDGSQYFGAWIDYNHNGSYEAGEFLGASGNAGASGTASISFTIPTSAINGLTHIRIIGGNDSPLTSAQACGASSSAFGETQDYDITITGAFSANPTYSWSDGTTVVGTTNPLTVTPSGNTNYTGTVTAFGCSKASNILAITTLALPNSPEAHNSTQCGTGVPEAFVTSGGENGTYRWYDAQTGGNLLQDGGALYTASISSTTSFWVSESNGTCESPRTEVIAAVVAPDAVHATADHTTTCLNSSIQLSAANIAPLPQTNTYSYSWTAIPAGTASGIASSTPGNPLTVTPTVAGTYKYVVKAIDGDCTTTDTVTVTVNPLPSTPAPIATPATVCAGANVTLSVPQNFIVSGPQSLPGTYCVPSQLGGAQVTQVSFNTLSQSGISQPSPYYNIYPAVDASTTTVTAGQAYNLTLATAEADGPSIVSVWIDYNRNGVFEATEWYQPWTAATSGTISITIPTNAVAGQTGMRIRSRFAGNASLSTDACTSFGSGTTEDYTINILGLSPVNPAYTYVWNPGALSGSSVTANPTTPTIYTVTVTDPSTTCVKTATVSVNVNPLPALPSAVPSEHCGTQVPDASVSSNSSPLPPNPVFNWYSAPTGGTLLQSGTSNTYLTAVSTTTHFYVAEVSANGCIGPRVDVLVSVITADPITASATATTICLGTSSDLSVTYVPDNNTYTFTWAAVPSSGSGLPVSASGTPVTVTPTAAGTYVYTVTGFDVNKGCSTTSTVTITVNPAPFAAASASAASVCTGATVNLYAGLAAPVINEGFTTVSPLPTGWASQNLSNPVGVLGWFQGNTSVFNAHSGATNSYIAANFNNVSGSGTISNWLFLPNIILTNGDEFSFWTQQDPAQAVADRLEVRMSANGASVNAGTTSSSVGDFTTLLLTVNPASAPTGYPNTWTKFTATISGLSGPTSGRVAFRYNIDNAGDFIGIDDVTYTQVPSFSWTSSPAGFTSSVQNPTGVTVNQNTVYTLTTTNGYGCTSSSSVTVNATPLPNAPVAHNSTQCGLAVPTASVTTGGSNGTYTWYDAQTGGTVLQTGGSTYTTAISTTTTFYVSENNGTCESLRTPVTVTVTTPATISLSGTGPATICLTSSVNLNASSSAAYAYTWTASPVAGSGIPTSLSGPTFTITPTAANTYIYTVTGVDNSGPNTCTATAIYTVVVNSNPAIDSIKANPSTICAGPSSVLTVYSSSIGAGPQTFPVYTAPGITDNASGDNISLMSFSTINNASGGDGVNGFEDYSTTVPAPTITAGNPYTLTVNVANGGIEYAGAWFDWNRNGAYESSEFYNIPLTLVSGTYQGTITINVPATAKAGVIGLRVRSRYNTALTGTNANTAYTYGETEEYAVNVIGVLSQTPAYNYSWNTTPVQSGVGLYSITVNPTVTTSYIATVTNPATGCSSTSPSITVTVTPVTASATATPATPVCAGTTVSLNANQTGGAPFSYSWSDGTSVVGITNPLSVTPAVTTTYTVTVGDACGNTTTSSVTVTVNPLPTASIAETGPITICSPATQVLTAQTTTPNPGYQWTLNGVNIGGATAATYTVTSTGSYAVKITETSTGCLNTSAAVSVTINPQPAAVVITPAAPAAFCDGGSVSLTATSGSSGTGTIGTGTVTNTTTTPYKGFWGGSKVQYLYTAAELTALGMTSGSNITAISMNITAFASPYTFNGFTIAMKNTASTSLTGTPESGTTTVFGPTNYTLTGTAPFTVSHTLSTAFTWNGTSNVVVEFCFNNNNSGGTSTNSANVRSSTITGRTTYYSADNTPALCSTASGWTTSTTRANMTFTYSSSSPITLWSPATGLNSTTGATVIASPSVTTIYTARATNSFGCNRTNTVTVTVNPRPTGVISGAATYCANQATTTALSIAVTGAGPWSGTITDGTTTTPFSGSVSPISVSVTPTATSTYTIATLNGSACSSIAADLSGSATITVNPLAANPTANVMQPTCTVATGTITVTSPLGAGYTYSINGTMYQPGTTFTNVSPGTYNLTVQTSSGCFSPASTSVTVNPQPFTPSAPMLSGIVSVCPYLGTGQQLTYTAAAPGATGFNWLLPPNVNLVSGQGTSSIVVTLGTGLSGQANKQLRVTATSTCGTSPLAILYLLTEAPHTPDPITGPVNLCPLIGTGTVATYIIPSALSATRYTWIVPANTTVTHPNIVNPADSIYDTVINVVYNAGFQTGQPVSISAIARNGCGLSGTRTIQLSAQPAGVPGLINGPTNVCANILPGGTAATYSVAAMSGVTSYSWTTPSGTTVTHPNGSGANDYTITVLYPAGFTSGTITVTATNGCGMGSPRSLSITKLNPSTPSNIDVIQTHFCGEPGGRVFTYTISAMPANATSILWTIPTTGAMLVSGQGSTSITVSYTDGAVNSSVTATAQNNCANSSTRSVLVKLPACPVGFAGGGKVQSKLPAAVAQSSPMEVRIFPNPTVSDFKLEVLSRSAEQIDVRVIDIQGKLYKSFRVAANQVIALGAELKSGSYLVEVRQGTELKTTKVVKF